MIKVGIIGGAGYTAGELIRLLLNHPDVELKWVHSTSNAGNPVSGVHQGLVGETALYFTNETPLDAVDVIFLCTPHGESRKFLELHKDNIPDDLRIIDLSQDFRIADDTHDFIYGLPELNRKYIIRGKHVANPGCFATAIQLALLPLARNLLLNSDIHVNAITGSTGAGVKPSATSHYSWRNDNVSIYKPFTHQHLAEIYQTLHGMQASFNSKVNFIPVRGCFSRGIFATLYMDCPVELSEIKKLYNEYYDDHNFTFVSDRMPDLKDVVNTNKCLLYLTKEDGKLLIVSVIDNLLKGASGQAVHNMNLLFGLHERVGLQLKASAF
ncbi:MAG TPA: N-acetyl-gamma-glutamyl-phosphate reductase [Candidatus Limisoma intestinavium]|uniref:N-acetyl-gamma-glutamyl-phosphate reductase n=1 Tax=Candidatus Limisoma intestinavium TaxID=2840856 RepID=A0A9D1IJR1_9BACT|nr:N-acetyl-gamma-glutamyl-phosphate reductase [Candidatus Limisoma intestinavium]